MIRRINDWQYRLSPTRIALIICAAVALIVLLIGCSLNRDAEPPTGAVAIPDTCEYVTTAAYDDIYRCTMPDGTVCYSVHGFEAVAIDCGFPDAQQ